MSSNGFQAFSIVFPICIYAWSFSVHWIDALRHVATLLGQQFIYVNSCCLSPTLARAGNLGLVIALLATKSIRKLVEHWFCLFQSTTAKIFFCWYISKYSLNLKLWHAQGLLHFTNLTEDLCSPWNKHRLSSGDQHEFRLESHSRVPKVCCFFWNGIRINLSISARGMLR